MPKDWVISPPATNRDQLARELRVSPVVAQVLCNRGVVDAAGARQFLKPQITDLHPPEALPGAVEAAERIFSAIESRRKIVIFGDYDVDGITAVSILWHCLKIAGADASYYIPHRLEEGYGISEDAVRSLAADGAQLIITVDCGVTGVKPAALAKQLGVELIITDHHQPARRPDGTIDLPDALLVHPGLPGHEPAYPNPNLCGAGVALKLAWAISQKVSRAVKVRPEFRDFLVDAIGLAAMGTVADVVPLIGENRAIVQHGLSGLQHCKLCGVQALLKFAGASGRKLEGFDVGFRIGPRLNAIGRMGHARLAVDMLTRATPEEAERIAMNLDQQNSARQALEKRIAAQAHEMVATQGQDHDNIRAIVLASEGWHAGVIGIVAGRIAETYGKPAVLIALDNGTGQGSARSVRNFPLHEVFSHCRDHLLTYGGHAMAAGLRIETARLEAFREAFQARAAEVLTPQDMKPRLMVDDVVDLSHLDENMVADFARLEPFGEGNPAPVLATGMLRITGEPRTVGKTGTHLQVTLEAEDARPGHAGRCKGIAFGQASLRDQLMDHRRCRAAFRPIINEWNGRKSVEMQIVDFRFPD